MRRIIRVFLVGLLCFVAGGLCGDSVLAATEGTGTVQIYKAERGADFDKGSAEKCAELSGSDYYDITYQSKNNDDARIYNHEPDFLIGFSDNHLRLSGSGSTTDGSAASSVDCARPAEYMDDANVDYWLVLTDSEGNESVHLVGDGPVDDSGETMGWTHLRIDFKDLNKITYSNPDQDKGPVYADYAFDFASDPIEGMEWEVGYSDDFASISFAIPSDDPTDTCNNGVFFNNGADTYTIGFTSDGISGDNAGYHYGVDGVANFEGGGSCHYSSSGSHELYVYMYDENGQVISSDSIVIGDKTRDLVVKLSTTGEGDEKEIELSTSVDGYATGRTGTEDADYGSTGVTKQSECEKSGAAGNLGWIVCPILEWMKGAAQGIYNDYVAPSLQVKPELFTGGSGATHAAWSTFRDFANVLFIIFLLVIIFSQITGVGIDNYGIKKSLPKLILVAILINLSFVICQLCVDISNITGNGIQGIFHSVSPKESQQLTLVGKDGESATTEPIQIGTAIDVSLVSVGVLVAVFTAAAVIFNPAIILTFLIAALGVIIAIFFLFALLAARQAVIVVLTVLSPLAFMCYALPNMNKLFNKWLNLWKAMLLLYPICSLLVAGGNYVSSLLLSISGESNNTGFFFAFTAMVVGIIPVFFIPTVVKSAFAAMGRLGATLSGMGALASGAAKRKAENSELNKRAQEASKRRSTRIRAGVDRKGNAKEMGRFRRAMLGGKRSIAENRAQYMKDQEAKIRADSLMDEGYDAAKIRQEKRVKEEGVESYMTLINQATRNGENTAGLDSLYKQYMANGDANGAVAVARIAARTGEGASRFLNQNIRGVNVGAMNEKERGVFASVAKEIATGKESGTFRSVNPFAFEFAAQYNRDPGGAAQSYDKWNEGGYAHNAINNYITSPAEMAKLSEGAWEEILGKNGKTKLKISSDDAKALREVATLMNNNKGRTGVWNQSTARYIEKVAKNGITT